MAALFRPLDSGAEVVALALDRFQVAVELADPDDAVEERGVAVVVEDEVAVGRPVADVSGGGIVPFGRALERQLAGKRSGLFDVVVVAEGERQRQLSGEIARRGVVMQPSTVSPKVIRIGVPSEGLASWSPGAGLGLADGSGVLAPGAPVAWSPFSSPPPQAESEMVARKASR